MSSSSVPRALAGDVRRRAATTLAALLAVTACAGVAAAAPSAAAPSPAASADAAVQPPASADAVVQPPVVQPPVTPAPMAPTTTPVPAPRSLPAAPPAATAPVVTTQPKEVWVDRGQPATFTAHASGSPTPTVQWQRREFFGAPWVDVPGATSDSHTTAPTSTIDEDAAYRAIFSNSAGSVTTAVVDLRLNPLPPAAGTPSAPRNVRAW